MQTQHKTAAFFSAIILFYMSAPYFVWHGFFGSIYVKTILAFILGGLFFVNRRKQTGFEISLFFLLFGTMIVYFVVSRRNFNFFLSLFPVVLVPFTKESFSRIVFRQFINIFVLMLALALVFWLFALLGIVSPYKTIPPLNVLKTHDYFVFPFFVSPAGSPTIRFYGPFDEPGVVGTLCGILLCIEKFNLKNAKSIILLIAGLCSLSFFFYILVGVYFILYFAFRKKSISKTLLMALFAAGVFYTIQQVPVLNETLGIRFEWDAEKGTFVGDNRINSEFVQATFEQIRGTKQFWFGIDDKEDYLDSVAGSSSFITVIVLYGMVFTILYLLFFVLYALYYRESWWSVLLFIFAFFATIYQRPNTFNIIYVYLFTYLAKMDRIEKIEEFQTESVVPNIGNNE